MNSHPKNPLIPDELQESFAVWAVANAEHLEAIKQVPRESLEMQLTASRWHIDILVASLKISEAWNARYKRYVVNSVKTAPQLREGAGQLISAQRAVEERRLARAIVALNTQDRVLADGRVQAVKARRDTSATRHDRLDKAVAVLFEDGGRGWQMTCNQITDHCVRLRVTPYAFSTVLKRVSREAAKHRKAKGIAGETPK